MSYPKKYRKRTIEYRQEGHTLEETHQTFKVSKSTIQKWEKQWKETGDLGKKELHRGFRKIDPEKLKAHVAEHPDAYQSEMAQAFGCTEFSLSRPGVAPERAIGTDGGNGGSDFVNNILDGTTAAPAVSKEAGADKTVLPDRSLCDTINVLQGLLPT